MKKSVMDRPMFKGEDMEEMDVENVGIMSGFKEDFDEDDDFESMLSELDEGDDMYDSADMLDRRPNSPEILMNNLRGDMRSVDARREELADMVGMEAAMETPDEVLALLQTTLGAGIGALPMDQGPAMAPPEMGMPPAMPPGMPPAMPPGMPPEMGMPPGMPPEMAAAPPMPPGMPPMNMARGGFVQRFSEGSDEDAVTPAQADASSPALSSEQLQTLRFLMDQSRPKTGDLRTAMESRMPVYKELLGGDTREMVQGQALLDIGQGFFNLASNRGPQGEALRGSGVSRLAGAFRGVPAQIAARAGELSKQEQAVKLAALQSAEKDIELQRTLANKVAIEEAKAAARGVNPFGTGLKGSAYNQAINLAPLYAEGTLDPRSESIFLSSIKILTSPDFYMDDMGYRRAYVPTLPEPIADALRKRGTPIPTPTAVTGAAGQVSDAMATEGQEAAPAKTTPEPTGASYGVVDKGIKAADGTDLTKLSLWQVAPQGTGFINVPAAYVSRFPLMGELATGEQQANAFLSSAVNQINRGIATNPRFSEGERKAIEAQLNIDPSMLLNPTALRQRLIALDRLMLSIVAVEQNKIQKGKLPAKDRNEALAKIAEVEGIREIVGIPKAPIVRSSTEFDKLKKGDRFWMFNPKTGQALYNRKEVD